MIIELLRVGVFKSLLSSVPARSFKEETVDVNTLVWSIDGLSFDSSIVSLDDVLQDLGRVDDLIKRPVLGFSLSGDLLLHGSEETLWVEETGQPEGWWSFLGDPSIELMVSIEKTLDPSSK